jgi:hypothetical protein
VQQEHRRSQCDWLLQAGRTLAASRIQSDGKYPGEIWEVPAEQFGGSDAGQVLIEVTANSPAVTGAQPRIKVIARFPKDSPKQVQLTAELD